MNIQDYDWDRLLAFGFSEDSVKGLKKKYGQGLTAEEKKVAKREIKETMAKAKEAGVSAKDLYADWESDKSYKNRKEKTGSRIPESESTKAYRTMFDNHAEASDTALQKKAKESGISLSILKKVFQKGMAAWRSGHRPGVSPQQWAMGRVNSFITGKGGARKADKDLWSRHKGKTK